MSRSITAALLAAIQAGTVRPIIFYQGEFQTGILYLWNGVGDIVWNGHTWTGASNMLSVTAAREVEGIEAVKFTVALNGESQALLSINLQSVRQGLPGTIWLGALDSAGAVIADPQIMFKGNADVPDVLDSGETATLALSYESRLIDLQRSRVRRYTDQDQRIDYPNDKGLEFVTSLQDSQIAWGGPGRSNLRQ